MLLLRSTLFRFEEAPPAAGLPAVLPALSFESARRLWKKLARTLFCVPPAEGVPGEVGNGGEDACDERLGDRRLPFVIDDEGRDES